MLKNRFKKQKNVVSRSMKTFVFFFLAVLFLAGNGNVKVSAAEGGVSASIQFGDKMDSYAYEQAIELGLYRIGTYTGTGYEMDPAFAYAADLAGATAEEIDAIIARVESDVKESDGSFKAPDYYTTVNGSTAAFTNVAPGAYLAAVINGPSEVSMMSFFFLLTDGGGVNIDAKWTFVTKAEVQKLWDDGPGPRGQDGIRPSSITVQLYGNDIPVGSPVVLSIRNRWAASVDQLPKYDEHEEPIVYVWHEIDPKKGDDPGHTYAPAGYTKREALPDEAVDNVWRTVITNRHTPETKILTVKKVWDDEQDKDKRRPLTLTVSLLADGDVIKTFTLTSENDWTAVTDPLPVNDSGFDILYTWTEIEPEEYTLESIATDPRDDCLTIITNKYAPDTTSSVVQKVWDDQNDQDGKRPKNDKGEWEITVYLINASDPDTKIKKEVLNEANNWTATATDLDKYEVVKVKDETSGEEKEESREIVYTWIEDVPEGYKETYTQNGFTTTITNTHIPETVELSIEKIWVGDENLQGIRPASVTVELLSSAADPNSPAIAEVILNEENGWFATVTDLPKYHEGKEIQYIWREIEVPNYKSSLPERKEGSTVTTITNTYITLTPTVTPSETPTPTPSETPTPTPSVTPSDTPTPSVSPSVTPSVSPSATPTTYITPTTPPGGSGGNPPGPNNYTPPSPSDVRTADDTNTTMWLLLLTLSFAALLLTISYMRRKNRS